MKKTLLLLFAICVSWGLSAARYELPISELGSSGWGDVVNDNGTVTYVEAWTGIGWWLSPNDTPIDFSAYNKVVINFEALPFDVKIVVEYAGDPKPASSELMVSAGSTVGIVDLNPDASSKMMQIYMQASAAGTIKVLEAYATDGTVEEPSLGFTIDFEADALETVYPTVGWGGDAIQAAVEPNPSGEGQSLGVTVTNWNSAVRFNTVKFPENKTLADVESIKFDIYLCEDNTDIKWKDVNFWFGAKGASFGAGEPTGGVNNLLGEETLGIWITKEAPMSGFTIAEAVLALNTIDMAMGVHFNTGKYYLDNITFVGVGDVAIAQIKADAPVIIPTNNGIKVINNGERVMVYGFDGRLIKQTYHSEIALERGLYIVKVGTTTAQKVLVK